ncbi:cytochrome b [Aquisalimonas asiatica]|uniref:Cytochrome b561 n=1 Tax=Aquisalimonas asiatica TaxID=406100 RepID=A0A1H8TZR4_9GAMM|nr:cytochrome b/b6 domain-containing protein [Aquisalimonas asiatica]SEO96355.1 cytochrome b561 [Aquisalimonas asiatica]
MNRTTAEIATRRYALVQRLLHWAVAALVVLALGVGMTLGTLGPEGARDQFGTLAPDILYTGHKTAGILILVLMVVRVMLRALAGKPDYFRPLEPWQRALSNTVHTLLYLLLITMPVLGWLATAAGDYPVSFFGVPLPGLIGVDEALSGRLFFWHAVVGWAILLLACVHIAGAVYHWRWRRDGVMQRMSLFR